MARETLVPYFCQFLQDSESEVRTAAVSKLGDFYRFMDANIIIAKVIPNLKKL